MRSTDKWLSLLVWFLFGVAISVAPILSGAVTDECLAPADSIVQHASAGQCNLSLYAAIKTIFEDVANHAELLIISVGLIAGNISIVAAAMISHNGTNPDDKKIQKVQFWYKVFLFLWLGLAVILIVLLSQTYGAFSNGPFENSYLDNTDLVLALFVISIVHGTVTNFLLPESGNKETAVHAKVIQEYIRAYKALKCIELHNQSCEKKDKLACTSELLEEISRASKPVVEVFWKERQQYLEEKNQLLLEQAGYLNRRNYRKFNKKKDSAKKRVRQCFDKA